MPVTPGRVHMMWRTLGISVLGGVGFVALSACKQDSSSSDRTPVTSAPSDTTAPVPPAVEPEAPPLTGGGTAQGSITFKGTPPPAAAITPSQDPACQAMPLTDQSLQVAGGKLGNVLVRKRVLRPYSRRTQAIVID